MKKWSKEFKYFWLQCIIPNALEMCGAICKVKREENSFLGNSQLPSQNARTKLRLLQEFNQKQIGYVSVSYAGGSRHGKLDYYVICACSPMLVQQRVEHMKTSKKVAGGGIRLYSNFIAGTCHIIIFTMFRYVICNLITVHLM